MKEFILPLLIGTIAGIIDILPMVKIKLNPYTICSAFVHYLIAPFFIFNVSLFGMPWWLNGGVINLMLAMPVIILVAKDDKKSIAPMTAMSFILGTLMGMAGHFLL